MCTAQRRDEGVGQWTMQCGTLLTLTNTLYMRMGVPPRAHGNGNHFAAKIWQRGTTSSNLTYAVYWTS